MSLKAFHILFVTLTTATSLVVAGLELTKYFSGGTIANLAMGVGGVLAAIALVVYGRYVLKKLQHISYL